MLSDTQLLTAPTSLASYKPDDISSSALALVSSSLLFWQGESNRIQEEERMAPMHSRSRSREDDTEMWFSMSSSARQQEQPFREPEQTAYQATSSRHNAHRSASPGRFPPIPLISTTMPVNKALPPSPACEKKKKRKPVSLRSLVRRRPSDQLDSSHLQPEPHQQQRISSANGNLSPDPYQTYHHQSSRSMPTSPAEFLQATNQPVHLTRAHSAAANYPDTSQTQAYPAQSQQYRSASMGAYFEPQPPRTRRTFPDSSTPSSATPRDSISDRQRPHTWLSPTEGNEPFDDASEFHLFVEATAGLPDGTLDFGTLSPSSPPHLQGSLFSRGRQNDQIPLPFQHSYANESRSQSHRVTSWQSMEYDYTPSQSTPISQLVSSSALPSLPPQQRTQLSPNMIAVNLELERLGLSDEGEPEDELPNYAQSQAEMSAKRRREATDRARELEARWNSSRSWRSR